MRISVGMYLIYMAYRWCTRENVNPIIHQLSLPLNNMHVFIYFSMVVCIFAICDVQLQGNKAQIENVMQVFKVRTHLQHNNDLFLCTYGDSNHILCHFTRSFRINDIFHYIFVIEFFFRYLLSIGRCVHNVSRYMPSIRFAK